MEIGEVYVGIIKVAMIIMLYAVYAGASRDLEVINGSLFKNIVRYALKLILLLAYGVIIIAMSRVNVSIS